MNLDEISGAATEYRIVLNFKQLDLVLNILGNAENSDDELGLTKEAREIGDVATCIAQQMIAQDK